MLPNLATPFGHVSYVVDPEKLESLAGTDWQFFLSPLTEPLYIFEIIATLVVTIAVFVVCYRVRPLREYCHSVHDRLLDHQSFVPLTLRLALGVALVVSGTKSVIFLPNVVGSSALGALEMGLGFSLLVGFFVRGCALMALGVFFYGLSVSHYMLGSMESAVAALLVAAHGPGRPSADYVMGVDFGDWLSSVWNPIKSATPILVRLALGGTLMWLAVTEKAMNPRVSEAVVIDFHLQSLIPVSTAMWVFSVGVIEFSVGLVLFLGFFTRSFSLIAFLVLTLSFLYFREEVVGHVTFFGCLIVLMVTGAGRCSLDSLFAWKARGVRGTGSPYAAAVSSPS